MDKLLRKLIKDHNMEFVMLLFLSHFVFHLRLINCILNYNRASVLDYLVHHVQCLGLFSTHYHRLAVEHEDNKVNVFISCFELSHIQVLTCVCEYRTIGITLPYGMRSRHGRRRFGRSDFPL
jgi:hypothetical protein